MLGAPKAKRPLLAGVHLRGRPRIQWLREKDLNLGYENSPTTMY